ncbi:MAG: AprI/Inh family metalloprotease inhibitor [Pseudomonadota bacterium]
MSNLLKTAGVVGISVLLAGCMGSRFGATPLAPTPTTPVASQTLPPPQPTTPSTPPAQSPAAVAAAEAAAAEQQVAALSTPPPATTSFGAPTVDGMSGGWTISDASGSCSLFISSTAWTGGYRAVTRGCPSSNLQNVNAWNVAGNGIALKDSSGAEIARLSRTGETQYNGAFAAGGPVSFSR